MTGHAAGSMTSVFGGLEAPRGRGGGGITLKVGASVWRAPLSRPKKRSNNMAGHSPGCCVECRRGLGSAKKSQKDQVRTRDDYARLVEKVGIARASREMKGQRTEILNQGYRGTVQRKNVRE